jgi:hypothetical protein
MSILAGASTYAIGQVAASHFEGGGSFTNIDMGSARRLYEEELERGKRVAEGLRGEKKDTIDKLERLVKLRDRGVLSDDEFEVQKKRVLSST